MSDKFKKAALEYHEFPVPGKLGIHSTKSTETQEDLALAYTPGVAEPVREIANNPDDAYRYTNKGNLVAVISDGTAVLGLGNTGALASKPVMEGKAVLFKRFANVDVLSQLFSDNLTKEKLNSEVVELQSGHVIVFRVKEHKPQQLMAFLTITPHPPDRVSQLLLPLNRKYLPEYSS